MHGYHIPLIDLHTFVLQFLRIGKFQKGV